MHYKKWFPHKFAIERTLERTLTQCSFFFFFFCPIKNPVAPIPVTEIQYLNVIGLAVLTGFLELQRILNLVYAEFQGDS